MKKTVLLIAVILATATTRSIPYVAASTDPVCHWEGGREGVQREVCEYPTPQPNPVVSSGSCPYGSYALGYSCYCYTGQYWNSSGTQCVDGDVLCRSKYGFNAVMNYSTNYCGCIEGYYLSTALGKCISFEESCKLSFGEHSKVGSSKNTCTCENGYVFNETGNLCVEMSCIDTTNGYKSTDGKCYCNVGYSWNATTQKCSPIPSPTPSLAPTLKPSPTPTFSDVNLNTPYSDSISELAKRKIVSGYPSGAYLPDKTLNRAELLKIVVGAKYGEVDDKEAAGCFSDVDASQWYAKYVCFAKKQNIVKGYADGTFKPSQEITFSEGVKIALAAWGKSFDTEPWYKGYLDYLEQNVVSLPGSLPDEKLTRGKMAHLIVNVMNKVK